ncbi:hypothetical protein [Sulfuricurvum sp.]|uniref:hypothetical protein n=1 Tax=Sulfuricurvum sp. TaxID=2025608 RepID=UPI003BB194D0
MKVSAWILVMAIIFTGCSQTKTALKMMDGLNYVSVHDLQDRVHYDQTAQLPNNPELLQIIDEAQPTVYGVLNKAVCSGSEKYLKGALFSFTPNETNAEIEFPFGDIVAENNICLDVTKIYDFSSTDENELRFSATLTSEKQKNIAVQIDLVKEEGRWCLQSFRKLMI